jgi:hypothetical protein
MTIIEHLRQRKGYLSTAELMATMGICRKTLTRWVVFSLLQYPGNVAVIGYCAK